MPIVESELALLRHPRLASLAMSAWPAWLWRADGSQILWANAAGAANFGAATTTVSTQLWFDAGDSSAAQIIRLAETLPADGAEQLERLQGFGTDLDGSSAGALVCRCSRVALDDGTSAVLVAATERARPALTLVERVRGLFDGADEALAAFAPDGALLYANPAGATRLGGVTTLWALDNETLAATALETGSAQGNARLGDGARQVTAIRLGGEDSRIIALILPAPLATFSASSVAPEQETVPAAEPIAAPRDTTGEAVTERRHPLRFVWHMDAQGHFGVGSDEFIELVGARTVAAVDRQWREISDELELDPNNQVAQAVATRETWSGIVVSWPVDDSDERLPVELSGLPVFDRERNFRGYRGFGVCRDVERINQLNRARRERLMGFMPAPEKAVPEIEDLTAAVAPEPVEVAPEGQRATPASAPAAANAANVVPFRPSTPAEPKVAPALSPVERRAFRELAQELTARLREPQEAAETEAAPMPEAERETAAAIAAAPIAAEHALLDRIPIGILIYRHDALLYANRCFLDWTGYESLAALEAAGGLHRLFAEPAVGVLGQDGGARSMSLLKQNGEQLPVDGRMITLPWNGSSALALILTNGDAAAAPQASDGASQWAASENRELEAILDAATDGILTLDAEGRVTAANARAVALFGRAASEMTARHFAELLTPGSERAARDFFARAIKGAGVLDNVLEVEAPASDERVVPIAVTLSRVEDGRLCALLQDISARKATEEELRAAKRDALRTAAAKTEFLAKISHEIRTPLNAITGFAEVIMAERLGPIGNERYREYLKDIHNAGTHLVSMLNDLLDLSKVETGQIELTFSNVNLNELTQQCVGIMQPQATRARIIIRTALTPGLPLVVADERSLRQIVLNLIGNSIKFTGPGGQVIVSTVFSDSREAVLRVRDTGVGMSEKDILAALEPFRQTATSGSWGSGGTGFGLPLTKALAEANRASFSIKSAPNAGTLVEIAFPPSRVVAD